MAVESLLGAGAYPDLGLWVADYGAGTPTTVPLAAPRVPKVGHFVGHQFAGDNGELQPYQGAIDLSNWSELPTAQPEPKMTIPNKLGFVHLQGGNRAGDWLAL